MKRTSSKKPPADAVAARLLGRRDHSRQELIHKLAKRGYREDEILPVLESLSEKGYLNDSRFALKWLEYFRENKPLGRERLTGELVKRGVQASLARDLVDREYSRSQEESLLLQLARQLLEKKSCEGLEEAMTQVGPLLARRGFGGGDIASAIRQVVSEIENREPSPYR